MWKVLASVAAAATLAGCASSSFVGSESATGTVRQFLEAAAARDGAAACGLLNGHGQQLMAAYAQRAGASARSCQQTVSRLGALPGSQDWDEMARGTICVYGTEGRDSQAIVVLYTRRRTRVMAAGSVQQVLGPGYRLTVPPTPERAKVGSAPPGTPKCDS